MITRAAARLLGFVAIAALVARGQEPPGDGPRVSAASSLADVVPALVRAAGVDGARLSFAGSNALVRQVQDGAPVDVVLLADEAWMDVLEREGRVAPGTRHVLATNELVVVVPRASAFAPAGPAALTDPRLRALAVAGEAVPAGRAARGALAHHGVLEALAPRLVSALNVRAALALVAGGQADAGIVYATDAAASPAVREAFRFTPGSHPPVRYALALTPRGAASAEARRLHAFLLAPEGRGLLAAAGFGVTAGRPAAPSGAAPGTAAAPAAPAADWRGPVLLSLWVGALALLVTLVPAVPLAWLLARRDFPGKSLVTTAVLVPLVLPPVVTGYLLLGVLGRSGPLAPALAALDVQVAFTRWGALACAAVAGFPLLVLSLRQAIEAVDPRYEQLAETLGLSPLAAFRRVTLPMALPGLLAGCLLAFLRGLGEFGATIVLAGDVPGETRTIALAVFALYEQPGGSAAASTLVLISLGLSLASLVVYEALGRAQRRRAELR